MNIKLMSFIVILSNLVLYGNSNLLSIVDDTTRCNPKPGGLIDMIYNVTDPDPEGHGGAKGNEIVDDAPAIQAWLNKIASNIINTSCERGGALYFPPGIYKIGSTLRIPPRCLIFGLSGGYTQSYAYNGEYYKHQSVVIKLAIDAKCNMIEPYPINTAGKYYTNYESVVIEGISLFGNKPEQGGSGTLKGIYLPSNPDARKGSESNDDHYRSNLMIKNVLISNINGYGFYSEENNKEFYLENVTSRGNTLDGFHIIKGEDLYFHRVWAGDNGSNGFYFYRSGALRFTNCDTWGSRQYGLNLEESFGVYCNTVIVNNNYLSGARLKGSGLITFINSNFAENSEIDWNNPKYSEVEILPNSNNYGVYGLKFIGCRFGGMAENHKTLYAVQENSTNATIRSNSFIGCTFIKKSIYSANICDSQVLDNYTFEGCTAGTDGQDEIYNPNSFLSIENQSSIELKKQNKIVSITNSKDCIVNLPSLSSVPTGKEYIIIKADNNSSITINPAVNELINDKPQMIISSAIPAYTQIKLINGGKRWIHILSDN